MKQNNSHPAAGIRPRQARLLWAGICLLCAACGQDTETAPQADSGPDQQFKWKMVTTWPVDFPIFQEGAKKFAEDVRVMSRGRLELQVYAGGELIPALEVFDAVSQGSVEMGHGSAYYWAGKVPAAQFFSSVPFGISTQGMHTWLHAGGGLQLWRDLYRPFNLIPFPMGNTGAQMGGWFNRRINSLDDLQGLRMRIPGLGGKVFNKAGGNPVLMAGGEIYTALERGTIDATEWVGPFHDTRLGLPRVAKYYYYPGWHEPGTEFELIVNTAAWVLLPADLQRIVEVAAAGTGTWIQAQMDEHNRRSLAELKKLSHVELLAFPPAVLDRLRQLTRETLEEEAALDSEFAKVYQAFKQFQANQKEWNDITVLPPPPSAATATESP